MWQTWGGPRSLPNDVAHLTKDLRCSLAHAQEEERYFLIHILLNGGFYYKKTILGRVERHITLINKSLKQKKSFNLTYFQSLYLFSFLFSMLR